MLSYFQLNFNSIKLRTWALYLFYQPGYFRHGEREACPGLGILLRLTSGRSDISPENGFRCWHHLAVQTERSGKLRWEKPQDRVPRRGAQTAHCVSRAPGVHRGPDSAGYWWGSGPEEKPHRTVLVWNVTWCVACLGQIWPRGRFGWTPWKTMRKKRPLWGERIKCLFFCCLCELQVFSASYLGRDHHVPDGKWMAGWGRQGWGKHSEPWGITARHGGAAGGGLKSRLKVFNLLLKVFYFQLVENLASELQNACIWIFQSDLRRSNARFHF